MAINLSVQHSGGFLHDIILSTQCYYHRGTLLNAMKKVCMYLQPIMIPPKHFDIPPPLTRGCSEGLDAAFRFFLQPTTLHCFVYFKVNNDVWSFLDYVEDI